MSEVELKPCPFCGSTDLDYGIYTGTLKGFDYVECQNCGGKINAIHKPKLICAEKLWNKRADEKHGVWIGYTKVGCYKHLDKNGNPIDRDCKYYECDKCRHRLVYKSNFCPNCGAKMEEEKMTNFEKIKQMTVEEMVEFINCEGACNYCVYADDDDCKGLKCREGIREWLKQEAEE